jgi:hypothetical protein
MCGIKILYNGYLHLFISINVYLLLVSGGDKYNIHNLIRTPHIEGEHHMKIDNTFRENPLLTLILKMSIYRKITEAENNLFLKV